MSLSNLQSLKVAHLILRTSVILATYIWNNGVKNCFKLTIIFVNNAFAKRYKLPKEYFIGKKDWELPLGIESEDAKRYLKQDQEILLQKRNTTNYPDELWIDDGLLIKLKRNKL